MTTPSSSAQALNGAAPSVAYNRLRLDALGSLEADSNGVTTNGGGSFVNNSGVSRSVGDVVIYDTTANDDFTTTTTVGDGRVLGVVIDGSVANGVKGAVQTRGPALVNVTGTVSRGDYLVTSGTAGLAQSNGPSMRPGVFGVALEASSAGTVIALLYGTCVFGLPQNQLVNGGFEQWQRGNGPFTANAAYSADRWSISLAGTDALSISKDTASADIGGVADAVCTFTLGTGGGATSLVQNLKITADNYQLAGRTISASIRVKTATANAVKLTISGDGTGAASQSSAFHPGDGAYHTLTATYVVPSNATVVAFNMQFAASCTANIDNAMLVIGNTSWDYMPLPPADDLARCLRYYEIIGGGTTEKLVPGMATSTTATSCWLRYRTPKSVVPTVTFTAASNYDVLSSAGAGVAVTSISAVNITKDGCEIAANVASGLTAGNGTVLYSATVSGTITIEANP